MSLPGGGGGGPSGMALPCTHGVTFPPDDEYAEAIKGMQVHEIRARWPRHFGICQACGWEGIHYASYIHYLAGDW